MKTPQNTTIKTADGSPIGYIFNFTGHGAFAPTGKVGELSQPEIDAHNHALAELEVEAMKASGRAVLYRRTIGARIHVGTWEGSTNFPVTCCRESRHNIAGTREDVWFNFDGSRWHGVNIGDNDICRVHRCKS